MKNSLKSSNLLYSQRNLRLPIDFDGGERQQMQLLMQLFAVCVSIPICYIYNINQTKFYFLANFDPLGLTH